MKSNRTYARRGRRRGTIYAIVLLSSLLVATLGVSALQLVRLQSRTASDYSDFIAARAYARAAIDIGMLNIRNDPYWRVNFGNGNWVTDKTIDAGKFSISAVDPFDNDVSKGDNHPIILTGTGKKGNAAFKISARLEVGPRVGSCLEVSMISGRDTSINTATLTSDQTISANGKVSAGGGSTVNADVEAYGSIGGSTYTKTILQKTVSREMPDPAHALDYYLSNGTMISYTALTLWSGNEMVTNNDFETDLSNWYAKVVCVLQQSTTEVKGGSYAMKVKSRNSVSDVAAMDLPPGSIKNGNTYHVVMPLYAATTGTAQAALTIESTGDGVQTFTTPTFTVAKNGSGVYTWVNIVGDITPTWTGDLVKATLSPLLSFRNDYYIDKVSVVDVTYNKGDYVLDGRLLSPTINPFGAANAQGIYVINCNNKDISVGRSRIVGTLVLLDPGGNTTIGRAVSIEPAKYNFPALLANKKITIQLDSGGLSESTLGVNFNPAGTPYPFLGGTSNATLTDSYASKITGLVYSCGELKFAGSPTISGVVIADQNITVNTATMSLSYVNTYLNDPPPGFDIGTITMKIVPGTWKRTIN